MKFTLIHPSRGRCQMAYEAFQEWIGKASGENEIEYILSLDADDPHLQCYKDQFKDFDITLLIGENRSLIDAVNAGAKRSSGECLIVVSDDFGCPEMWDEGIEKESKKVGYAIFEPPTANLSGHYFAIHINDTITNREAGVMTLPIISRAAYEQLGHIYNPVYFSMFADNELHDVCKANGCLIYSDLVFPHNHWVNGKKQRDATYNRQNAKEHYDRGKIIYEQRKAARFP